MTKVLFSRFIERWSGLAGSGPDGDGHVFRPGQSLRCDRRDESRVSGGSSLAVASTHMFIMEHVYSR
jgi:hypothetical protein